MRNRVASATTTKYAKQLLNWLYCACWYTCAQTDLHPYLIVIIEEKDEETKLPALD